MCACACVCVCSRARVRVCRVCLAVLGSIQADIVALLAEEIASDLKVNTTLTFLDVSNTVACPSLALPMAEMLKVNTALQTVVLCNANLDRGCKLDDSCATMLGKMLSVNSTLLKLDLGCQECYASGSHIGYALFLYNLHVGVKSGNYIRK